MKKIIYSILITFIISITVFSQEKKLNIDYRLMADFYAYPYFYEFTNKMNANSFNGSIFFGVKINEFTVGGEIFENYLSLTAVDTTLNYIGAWNIFGSAADFFYAPADWFEVKTGIGASWYKSAFGNSDIGTYSKNLAGLTILLDTTFKPSFEYIDFSLVNRLDFIFSSNDFNPQYTGKIRVNFHPYFNWIKLYLETGIMTMSYSGTPKYINAATFVWGTGISFDLVMPSMFKYTKEKVTPKVKKEKIEVKKEEKPEVKQEEQNIEELKTVKQGESVTFTDIIFYPDSDRMKAESFPSIDKIADVLKERSNIVVEIIGHTNNTNKPELEIALSKKRAETVKNYLVKKGIDPVRMKTTGYGSQFTKNATIEEANRKVEIKILEVK
jgi:outer membrane protein OmpA-like peptidoglycan-associated protein